MWYAFTILMYSIVFSMLRIHEQLYSRAYAPLPQATNAELV